MVRRGSERGSNKGVIKERCRSTGASTDEGGGVCVAALERHQREEEFRQARKVEMEENREHQAGIVEHVGRENLASGPVDSRSLLLYVREVVHASRRN